MAFNENALTKVGNLVSVTEGQQPSLNFYSTADNLATMTTAGYFNDARDIVISGSFIIASASDGFRLLKVTSPASGNVTVSAQLGAVS